MLYRTAFLQESGDKSFSTGYILNANRCGSFLISYFTAPRHPALATQIRFKTLVFSQCAANSSWLSKCRLWKKLPVDIRNWKLMAHKKNKTTNSFYNSFYKCVFWIEMLVAMFLKVNSNGSFLDLFYLFCCSVSNRKRKCFYETKGQFCKNSSLYISYQFLWILFTLIVFKNA